MTYTRRIRLPHLYNFRDLGGYAAEGFTTDWGKLFRSDCLSDLDKDEWERLKSLGIRHLIDLRSTYEVMETPVAAPDGMICHQCHFIHESDTEEDPSLAAKKFLDSLSLDYSFMMKNSLSELAQILKTVNECLSEGGVCFFCTAGKDRTGMLAAVILYLCGVSREDIIADYCVTEVYNADVIKARIESLPSDIRSAISPESMEMAVASKAGTMEHLLDWMEGNNIVMLLEENGFGVEDREKLLDCLGRMGRS